MCAQSENSKASAEIVKGKGNRPEVKLQSKNGATAFISMYGAHVLSWSDKKGREILFLSEKADYSPGKAVRGGIPVIFPWFGVWGKPSHGFARTQEWQLIRSSSNEQQENEPSAFASFQLVDTKETLAQRADKFSATLTYHLNDSLHATIEVTNNGNTQINLQFALHSYFNVKDVSDVQIFGLAGLTYIDNTHPEREKFKEEREIITIDQEIDRIYTNALVPVKLQGPENYSLSIESSMKDRVVWNPWVEKTKSMSDLSPEDYKRFVCIEAGDIIPLILEPGKTYSSWMKIIVTDIP